MAWAYEVAPEGIKRESAGDRVGIRTAPVPKAGRIGFGESQINWWRAVKKKKFSRIDVTFHD